LESPNGITTILFDLDGTLRFTRPASVHFFLDYAVNLGAPDSTESRRRAIEWTHRYWAQSAEMLQDLSNYPDEEQFWTHYAILFLKAYGCADSQAQQLGPEVQRYMLEYHRPDNWVPPETARTLKKLQNAGFVLGLVSNRTNPCQEELASLGLDAYFDLVLVAGEVNSWKPDPQIFHIALDRLGQAPSQAIYVGDNYYADILGARAAGVQPVLLDPEGIFPQADCLGISQLGQVIDILPLLRAGAHLLKD
jgi:HAD superfamily hydrolase (TIGR01549 family)